MNKIKNWHFWVIFVLIILLPLIKQWRLLLFGERIEGVVDAQKEIMFNSNNSYSKLGFYSEISYEYMGNTYSLKGPENINYAIGRKLPLLIDPSDPANVLIGTVEGFYVHKRSIVLIMVLLVWAALFTTLVQVRKGKISFLK